MKTALTQHIHYVVGQCKTSEQREMLNNKSMSMVGPALQEFGDAAVSNGLLEKVKIMLEKYHNAMEMLWKF